MADGGERLCATAASGLANGRLVRLVTEPTSFAEGAGGGAATVSLSAYLARAIGSIAVGVCAAIRSDSFALAARSVTAVTHSARAWWGCTVGTGPGDG